MILWICKDKEIFFLYQFVLVGIYYVPVNCKKDCFSVYKKNQSNLEPILNFKQKSFVPKS